MTIILLFIFILIVDLSEYKGFYLRTAQKRYCLTTNDESSSSSILSRTLANVLPKIYINILNQIKFRKDSELVTESVHQNYAISRIQNGKDLSKACDLCVEAFFGTSPSLLHRLKRRQVSVELREQLRPRLDNTSQYRDIFFVAVASQNISRKREESNLSFQYEREYIGFSLLSLVPVDEEMKKQLRDDFLLPAPHNYTRFIPKISNLCVREHYRGKGLGLKLLHASCDAAFEWGFNQVFLEVEEDNIAAIKLYLKAGFEILYSRSISVYDFESIFLRGVSKRGIVMQKKFIPTLDMKEVVDNRSNTAECTNQ